MEPIKIEKQFREKVNAREIKPTSQAWDRLDAMLSVAEEKKTRRPFGFLFIAASILVLATLGIFFFTQSGTEIKTSNEVVGIESKKDTVQHSMENIQTPIIVNQNENATIVSSGNKKTIVKQQSSTYKLVISQPNPSFNQNNQKTAVNQLSNANQNQIIKDKDIEFMLPGDIAIKNIPKINYSTEPIIIGGKNNNKSDEALLADLDKAVKKSSSQKTIIKVDAKNLLSQADGEVEYTFREKVINKVNKNYQEVKVALANRNNKE